MFDKPRRLNPQELATETSVIVIVRGYEDGFSPDIRRSRLVGIKHAGFILKIL
jgi:hypothetical protein